MANAADFTATIEVHRRSLLSRIVYLPKAYREHYRVLRRTQGRIVSAYGAWLMAGLIISVRSVKTDA